MIRVRDLTVSYGGFTALDSVSFDLAAGECLVVTGMSGCGKSTLARVLSGLIPQAIPASVSGSVMVAGLHPGCLPLAESAQHIGTVFQNPGSQLFHLRVEDEVAFGPYNLGLDRQEIKARVDWALDAVGLSGFHQRCPSALSGGLMQRLAIAAALAMRPRVLVLDEPTSSLDVSGTRSLVDTLKKLKVQNNLAIVIIEHRLAEVSHLADQVLVLHEGHRVAYGSYQTVLQDRAMLRRYGLRRPTSEPLTAWEQLLTPDSDPGKELEPLLAMQSVSAGYDHKAVIHNVDLCIYPGEFVALVGDNGSGKSTLALTAAGLLKPLGGHLSFSGRKRPLAGRDVALLFQDPTNQLLTDSVDEEVAFGPRNYRLFDPLTHADTLSSLDLLNLLKRRPTALSMGQQQRTALAACLAVRPQLVILDEPTLGQDWRHLQQLMEFLQGLNRQGTAILLITHDFKLVYRYAQRVMMLREGRLVISGHVRTAFAAALSPAGEEAFSLAS